MSPRLLLSLAGVALAVLVGLAFLGRWEQRHNAANQNARMAAVYRLATSDGLLSRRLDAYRLASAFDCLLYAPPGDPKATSGLELCFDGQGRLVQTIDRRQATPRFASLQEQPSLATVRVPVPQLEHVLVATGVYARDPRLKGAPLGPTHLPISSSGDVGVFAVPKRVGR